MFGAADETGATELGDPSFSGLAGLENRYLKSCAECETFGRFENLTVGGEF